MEHLLPSPIGLLRLTADSLGLTACHLVGKRVTSHSAPRTDLPFTPSICDTEGLPFILAAEEWLTAYFSRHELPPLPSLHLIGTPFQLKVWQLLQAIPYGETSTYGTLARQISPRMSAQAVGQAVSHNPVAILVPCHRVLAAHGLGGYAYGTEIKSHLLSLEHPTDSYFSTIIA